MNKRTESDVSNRSFDVYRTHYSISFIKLMRQANMYERDCLKRFFSFFIRVRFGAARQFKKNSRLRMCKSDRGKNTSKRLSDNQCLPRIFVYALVFFIFPCPVAPCFCLCLSLFACLPVYLLKHCLFISMFGMRINMNLFIRASLLCVLYRFHMRSICSPQHCWINEWTVNRREEKKLTNHVCFSSIKTVWKTLREREREKKKE